MNEILSTDRAPKAIGPYSQGVRAGNIIFVSGQLPLDPDTGVFASDEIRGQTAQSLKNIAAILATEDADFSDVVKTTVYLKNMDDFAAMNEVYAQHFTANFPARAAVEVARLPKDALVEIEAVAYKFDAYTG